jgi:hypothetical protein
MIFLGILIGFILGLPIGFIKWKKKPLVEKYSRRGLLVKEYTVTDGSTGRTSKIECVFEVGELESTDTLSKVEVVDVKPNQSQYNTDYERKRLTEMVDKSWVPLTDIHWITTAADVRNKKIDEILN